MPLNSRGQRTNNHNMNKQKEMAKALRRKPSTGGTSGGGSIGGAAAGGGS
jgi:hypothetical protein